MVASALGKRLRQLEDTTDASSPAAKYRRAESGSELSAHHDENPRSLRLDELTSFCDYVVPANALRRDRYLSEAVADRHLNNFFRTTHVLLPILDPAVFRGRYSTLRKLFGDRRLVLPTPDGPGRPQFVCLLYSVLALGALYEDGHEDSSSWASWYFAEAQDMLGHLLDATNLQSVQAAVFLEARRTWWVIYIQDVELSLDSGRPMSVSARSSQVNFIDYPVERSFPRDGTISDYPAQVPFIRYLADLARLTRKILKLAHSGDGDEPAISRLEGREALRQELDCWRSALPSYLSIDDRGGEDTVPRQQSSLRIHYNLSLIILLRSSVTGPAATEHDDAATHSPGQSLTSLHRAKCLDAARDMISHIHQCFELEPALRRWSYYCFYCLQATLVLLPKVADDYTTASHDRPNGVNDTPAPPPPAALDPTNNTDSAAAAADSTACRLAVEIFAQIRLKASQRCADLVRQFLEKWTAVRPRDDRRSNPLLEQHHARTAHPAHLPPRPQPPSPTHSGTASPGVLSLDGLQAELYGALYGTAAGAETPGLVLSGGVGGGTG
ncbi:hypothetical protein C8A05DRAFT_36205 [Staphylotrichum tortipilum]|uniref:Transcription factor domain-containing protein n=1 Tax=Staphylotrichum tortipilum TaxID=2831512 RepID=A0AAN6MFX3_9PEZI|nr:hypothetical protein C8A05DRAFT_36205 [Staphylotrichum longicolle]